MSLPSYETPDLPPESLDLDSDVGPRELESSVSLFGSRRVIILILLLLILSLLAGLFGSAALSQFAQSGL